MKNLGQLSFLFLTIIMLAATSCKKDEEIDIVDFGEAPSTSLLTLGDANVITENTVRYHVLTIGGLTSTIVESETGIVIVDLGAPFAGDTGSELRAYADAIEKPMSIVLTHDHSDHYGNIDKFTDVQVFSETSSAAALMADTTFTNVYTSSVISVTSSMEIQGFLFGFGNVNNAETVDNGYAFISETKAFFPGDLVYNATHSYLVEYSPLDGSDEIDNWISGLNNLKSTYQNYSYVFVAHDGFRSDIATTIDENIAYLSDVQGLIKGTKTLTAGGTASTVPEVIDEITLLYPNYHVGARDFVLAPGAVNWF